MHHKTWLCHIILCSQWKISCLKLKIFKKSSRFFCDRQFSAVAEEWKLSSKECIQISFFIIGGEVWTEVAADVSLCGLCIPHSPWRHLCGTRPCLQGRRAGIIGLPAGKSAALTTRVWGFGVFWGWEVNPGGSVGDGREAPGGPVGSALLLW